LRVGEQPPRQHVVADPLGDVEVDRVERVVLVPREELRAPRVLEPVEVEVVHPRVSGDAVVFGEEIFDRQVPGDQVQVEIRRHFARPDRVRRLVDGLHHVLDRPPDHRCGRVLVGLRVEDLVAVEIGAEVLEPVFTLVVVLEQVAVVLRPPVAVGAEYAAEEPLVDGFGDHVGTGEGAVDEQARVRFARRRQAHAPEERHRQPLAQHRRILNEVVEHERLQSKKGLIDRIAIDVHPQPRLGAAAAAQATGSDPDVLDDLVSPRQRGRVIDVLSEVLLQRFPILRVQRQVNVVYDGIVEEPLHRLRRCGTRHGERGEQHDHSNQDCCATQGIHLKTSTPAT
jgi:hypothetical protein